MTKGENSKTTPELVFPSYGKNIGRKSGAKHSKIMRESKEFIRMSMVRIDTHVSAGQGQGTTKKPTKKERQSHEATHCLFRAWCEICVKAKSFDGKHTKQLGNPEHILLIEFDYAFATDTPGDPNKKISITVATDTIHGSIVAVGARRKGGQDDFVMQSFQNYIDRLGLVKAELKCDQEPSTLNVANALVKRCQSTSLIVLATPKGSRGSLERGERTNLTIQGQLQAFREAVSVKYKTEIGTEHVLMGWIVLHSAWVVNNFQCARTWENATS